MTIEHPQRTLLPILAIVATVFMWASTFVLMRWSAPDVSPGPFALLRLLSGSITLTFLILILRKGRLPRVSGWPLVHTVTFGVIWFATYTVVFNWAGHYLDAGTVAMVVNIAPLIVGVGAVVFFKEAFSRALFLGMLISLAGIALITIAGSVGQLMLTGLGIALVAALLYASGMLIQKVALRTVDPLSATWLACVSGTVALLPFVPQTLNEINEISTGTLLAAIYMGIGPTALGFWFWGFAMNHFPTGRVASATLAVPAVVVGLSAVFLHEVPPLLGILGGALCLTGVAVAQIGGRMRPEKVRSAEGPPPQ